MGQSNNDRRRLYFGSFRDADEKRDHKRSDAKRRRNEAREIRFAAKRYALPLAS